MVKAGIIDPAKVARTALQNAASVAGLMLTTDVLVTELKDDKKGRRADRRLRSINKAWTAACSRLGVRSHMKR